MPLLDHFRPPLTVDYQWNSFHHSWCVLMTAHLNRLLPKGFHAAPHLYMGIEIDVATLDQRVDDTSRNILREVAVAPYLAPPSMLQGEKSDEEQMVYGWQPPSPTYMLPFAPLTDSFAVLIYSSLANPSLVGVVELVSAANKDRPDERQAFVSKCEAYLRQGVGLVMVDIVTTYRSNLHQALLARLGAPDTVQVKSQLYATAYRPVEQAGQTILTIWEEALRLGQPLPTMPLWLRGSFCAPLDLDVTYRESCQALRIPLPSTQEAIP
jgi:hypothetical protein